MLTFLIVMADHLYSVVPFHQFDALILAACHHREMSQYELGD